MDKPNLFNYATSELSHDAFIAWLLSWADPSYKAKSLYTLSNAVLRKFFELSDFEMPDFKEVEVKRQFHNIDVYIKLTTTKDEEWAIIIENKIYTKQHSDQLNRYKETILEKVEDITENRIIRVYYKMWEQSNLEKVRASGYVHFDRETMFELMEKHYSVGASEIVDDYHSYIKTMQENIKAFKTEPVKKWNPNQWIGFYAELKRYLNEGNFDYVANPSGGFWGFWFASQPIGGDDDLYLQIEEYKFCFKININKREERQAAKWFWHERVIEKGKEVGLDIVKPPVMRIGKWFTIGILNTKKGGCWMVTDEMGKLDYESSLELLKKAIQVVEIASTSEPDYKN